MKKSGGCGTFLLIWIISIGIVAIFLSSINSTNRGLGEVVSYSVVLGSIISFIIFCFKMIIITSRSKSQNKQQRMPNNYNGIRRFQPIIHVGGLNVPENMQCQVTLASGELKIFSNGNEFVLPVTKIRNVEYQLNIDEKQYLKYSTAKTMIGAAAFGVPGAIIGSTPKKKTKREVKCYAIISYESIDGMYKTFILRDAVPNSLACAPLVDALRPQINQQVNRVQL